MLNPFRAIDHWASQSGDRTALILWLAGIAIAVIVVLAIVGMTVFTAPLPRH